MPPGSDWWPLVRWPEETPEPKILDFIKVDREDVKISELQMRRDVFEAQREYLGHKIKKMLPPTVLVTPEQLGQILIGLRTVEQDIRKMGPW